MEEERCKCGHGAEVHSYGTDICQACDCECNQFDGKPSGKVIRVKYPLRSKVRIINLEVIGTVRNIQIGMDGVAYKVSFYVDSKRCEEWVYEDEIAAIPKDES